MSTLSVIRKATEDDYERIIQAALRFLAKRGITPSEDVEVDVTYYLYTAHPEDKAKEKYAWAKAYCRALRVPYNRKAGICWGTVGIWTE